MANLLQMLLRRPLQSFLFIYCFLSQVLLVLLKRALLPFFPSYQSLRIQIQRCYLAAAAISYPELPHRLPVGSVPLRRARKVDDSLTPAYLIPGTRDLADFAGSKSTEKRCVVIYGHGGGYARGEARMYLNYMHRWVDLAARIDLDLVFLSVEYHKALSTAASHPAQRDAFLRTYKYVLDNGVEPENVVFMGDSAGGGLSILSALKLSNRKWRQPAASVLISPWIDMALTSYQGGNAFVETDFFVLANKATPQLAKLFIGNHSPTSPEVNPLHETSEKIAKLNPQLILAGGAEFALSDSKEWAQACEKAQLSHKMVIEWGQLHGYALGSQFIDHKVRQRTDDSILDWIKAHIA